MDETMQQALNKIKTRRLILWSVFLTYIPAIAVTHLAAATSTPTIIVFVLWLIMAAAGGVMVSFSRCPRCGNLFHMRGPSTSWSSRCQHCKLSLSGK